MERRIETYREFWPFYLAQHSQLWTKRFHVFGTSLGMAVGLYLGLTYGAGYWFIGVVISYGFAWTSHFFIEHNRPATFHYPFWSFISDFRMSYAYLAGRL